jgi:hypothetical protein
VLEFKYSKLIEPFYIKRAQVISGTKIDENDDFIHHFDQREQELEKEVGEKLKKE